MKRYKTTRGRLMYALGCLCGHAINLWTWRRRQRARRFMRDAGTACASHYDRMIYQELTRSPGHPNPEP